jgi:hypothetical protein
MKRGYWITSIIILILLIGVGMSSYYFYNKEVKKDLNARNNETLENVIDNLNLIDNDLNKPARNNSILLYNAGQASNLCRRNTIEVRSCSDLICEGKTIYVEGYTSQASLNNSLFLDPAWNEYSSEYLPRFSIYEGFGSAGNEVYVSPDKSLYMKDNIPDKEKLQEISNQLRAKIGGNYIKDRKVLVKVDIEKRDCYDSYGNCSACPRYIMKSVDDFVLDPSGDVTLPKEKLLEDADLCNEVMISKKIKDICFGYHYYERGCYYATDIKVCPGYADTWSTDIQLYELSYQESKNLCLRLAHKGLTAYCLTKISEDRQDCLDFANGDEYLTAICNLKEGAILNETEFPPRTYDEF